MINNVENLYNVMQIQSASYESERMERFITRRLNALGLKHEVDSYGNIYVTKGKAELYPTMVCHIDTVHEINNNVQVFKRDNKMFAMDMLTVEQYGIGGDDKVGIYITLSMLENLNNCKAVFFKDEEVGCLGSTKANFKFFDNSTIVLQCDRKHYGDFVSSINGTKLNDDTLLNDLAALLDNFNLSSTTGGLTDVLQIAKNNDVQVANLSCGYYNPHTNEEYIDILDVFDTEKFCYHALKATAHKRYTMKRVTNLYNPYSYGIGYNTNKATEFHPAQETGLSKANYCGCCGSETQFDEFEQAAYCTSCMTYTYTDELAQSYHGLF